MCTNDMDLIACTRAPLSGEGWTAWFSVWRHRESISANNGIKTYISISEKCLSIFSPAFHQCKTPTVTKMKSTCGKLVVCVGTSCDGKASHRWWQASQTSFTCHQRATFISASPAGLLWSEEREALCTNVLPTLKSPRQPAKQWRLG